MINVKKNKTVLHCWPGNLFLNNFPTIVGSNMENLLYCYPAFTSHPHTFDLDEKISQKFYFPVTPLMPFMFPNATFLFPVPGKRD